jgi:hypothetical protein
MIAQGGSGHSPVGLLRARREIAVMVSHCDGNPDKHLRILWQAAQDGHETAKRVVARLNEVERLVHQRIVVEETRRGWRSRIEPATV